jgi:DNA-binding NtrC family response regulator
MMTESEEIDVADLPSALSGDAAPMRSNAPIAVAATAGNVESDASLAEHERQLVANALERAKGNQSQAAKTLGIGRDALRYKMKKYGLL